MEYTLSREEARVLVLDFLRELAARPTSRPTEVQPKNILAQRKDGKTADNMNDQRLLCEILHEFYLERVIATGTSSWSSPDRLSWPFVWVTDYGMQVLNNTAFTPYDPDGYLRRLREHIENLDPIVEQYAAEALECFRRGCLLASSVMIGVASEHSVRLLVNEFANALQDATTRAEFERDAIHMSIKRSHAGLRRWIDKIKAVLPSELKDGLAHNLDGIFHLIRVTRNEAGHAIGGVIDQSTVHGNLLLFPGYCRFMYRMMAHVQANPPQV
mgnify:CR=1 FL=1